MTKGSKKRLTMPSFTLNDTSDENVKRCVDRYGNWTHYWLVKEQKYVKAVNHVLTLGFNKGPRFMQYLLSVSEEEAKRKLETAGEEGTRTHDAIHDLVMGTRVTMTTKYLNQLTGRQEILTPDEWDNLVAFQAWCEKYNPRTIAHEFSVYTPDSTVEGFAGTGDWLGLITVPSGDKAFPKEYWGQDIMILVDWKSSSGIWDEYKAQVAAYLHCVVARGMHAKFARAFKGRMFTGIVRLGTRHKNGGFEFKVWDETTSLGNNFELFVSAQRIAIDKESEWAPEVEEIPLEFYIKLPSATVPRVRKAATEKKPRKAKKAVKTKKPQSAQLFEADNTKN